MNVMTTQQMSLNSSCEEVMSLAPPIVKVYKRRWIMLLIFMVYSMCNAAQWIQYAIISNLVQKYYSVSENAVDWTSIVFMVTFVPLIFPATYMLEKWGLRSSIVFGSAMMAIGSSIKLIAAAPDRYYILMLGQAIVSVTQVLMLNVPPHLSTVWFGSNQVSTACSLAIFGNQFGLALGVMLPPLLVKNLEDPTKLGDELLLMNYVTTAVSLLIFFTVLALFEDGPPHPPSIEVANKINLPTGIFQAVKRMLDNSPFMLLLISYSLVFAVVNAAYTLLNEVILIHFQNDSIFAGRVGLLLVIGGMFGSVACGIILDKTHKYKGTMVTLNVLTLMTMIGFTFVLESHSQFAVICMAGGLGACLGGYLVVGFEFASELTYPEEENTMTGLLLVPAQILSFIATEAHGWLIGKIGDFYANAILCVALTISIGFTISVKPILRRQEAHSRGFQPLS